MKRHAVWLAALAFAASAHTSEAVRPEVAKPLKAAQELLKAGKPREALVQLSEADAVPGQSAYESFVIERLRGSAAASAGDHETTMKAFDAVLAASRLSADEQAQILEALAAAAFRAKDYARAAGYARRALAEGATSPTLQTLLAQALYLRSQNAEAAPALAAVVEADERAGRRPSETTLRMLADCQLKLNQSSGLRGTLMRLVAHHPKPAYWQQLLARMQVPERLRLDVLRLARATGALEGAEAFVETMQLAVAAGLPTEAKAIVDEGFAREQLAGDAHRRLQKHVHKLAADDLATIARNATQQAVVLVNIGYAWIAAGEHDKGLALMAQGVAAPGLKRPDEARLRWGVAQVLAGRENEAIATLRTVGGGDAEADLARLWLLHLKAP